MSTLTTRLQMLKPDGTDNINRINQLNNNWSILDSAVGVTECTSVTRPATPFPGQILRETDTLNVKFRNAANSAWVTANSIPIVSNTSDVTVPTNGQIVFSLGGGFSLWVYQSSASAWLRYPSDLVVNDFQGAAGTAGTTTSTTYTTTLTGGTACGVAFVAPPSGKVAITNQAQLACNATTNAALCTIEVRTGSTVGSGTIFLGTGDNNAVYASTTGGTLTTRRTIVSGLSAQGNYNVRQYFRGNGTTPTGYFTTKELIVEPI
jgi:hypothetical protein